jgi:Na+-transporting NADH:ubiquinone oxidoreductase subunit C
MKESNTYIFIYASVMVIIVAAVLSAVSTLLKPYQDLNIEMARKLDILMSVEKASLVAQADDRTAYINEEYEKYIVDSYVINHRGEIQEGLDAFEVNVREENRKPVEQRNLPVFVARHDDGSESYIIPVYGRGLWGPVFGYIALEDDYNTIFGVIFDHESETPGLGAEINTPAFQNQFKGKRLFDDDGEFVSIRVIKPGGGVSPNEHRVDGVSGGTITGNGVDAMLRNTLSAYVEYFRKQKNQEL